MMETRVLAAFSHLEATRIRVWGKALGTAEALARVAPKMGQHSVQDGTKMGPDGGLECPISGHHSKTGQHHSGEDGA